MNDLLLPGQVLFTNVANEEEIFTESDTTVMVSQDVTEMAPLLSGIGCCSREYTAIDFRVFGGPICVMYMRLVNRQFGSSVDRRKRVDFSSWGL